MLTAAAAAVRLIRAIAPPLGRGVPALLVGWPLVAALFELLVVAVAGLLRAAASFPPLRQMLLSLPLDPIYTGATLETFTSVRIVGAALASPLGNLLHAVLPAGFASPAATQGWAAIIIAGGSTVAAVSLSRFVAMVGLLAGGIVALRRACRACHGLRGALLASRWPFWLAVFGLLAQMIVIDRTITDAPSLANLEAMGISFAFGAVFPALTGHSLAISDLQAVIPERMLVVLFASLALSAAYGFAGVLVWSGSRMSRVAASAARRIVPTLAQPARLRTIAVMAMAIVLGMLVGGGLFATVSSLEHPAPAVASADLVVAQSVPVDASPTAEPLARHSRRAPSTVGIAGRDYRFTYLVNGEVQVVRGMGYNPMYATLDRAERALRYDRDFALMRRAGVNTIFGWVNAEFDDLTLDKAEEHGLGVALPYHIPPDLDFADSQVQAALYSDILAWVEAHRHFPALRMWAVGNEVLHKIVFPTWMVNKKNSPEAIARARAFARFYLRLAARVQQADPAHPVVLRDAEDVYLQWLREAIQTTGEHAWFVYGVNVYTNRLREVVENWPKQTLDAPLLISEFAPGGLGPKDRPEGYRKMWDTIRQRPNWTIGGVPYVWTTAGPEEVDRAFGLVDSNGKAVDGSLETIGRMFGETAPEPPR